MLCGPCHTFCCPAQKAGPGESSRKLELWSIFQRDASPLPPVPSNTTVHGAGCGDITPPTAKTQLYGWGISFSPLLLLFPRSLSFRVSSLPPGVGSTDSPGPRLHRKVTCGNLCLLPLPVLLFLFQGHQPLAVVPMIGGDADRG